ncbi:MAG: rhomboid family intramembrane serine protease [Eubacterium sp.]|nr:rhomboid family intramembrane serine protease [Eubacterium sp.]
MYEEARPKRPLVNIILVIFNVVVWCVMELLGDTLDGSYIAKYGGMVPDLVLEGEWYRLFTAMFVHFGAEHLANNMILLGAAGGRLETVIGSFRYLILYLGAGLTGNLLSFYIMERTSDMAVCAGASGAVFGMIGGLVWAAVRNKGRIEGLTLKGLLFMIALCLYYGITTAGVDNWAHLGGALGGFVLCILLYRKK